MIAGFSREQNSSLWELRIPASCNIIQAEVQVGVGIYKRMATGSELFHRLLGLRRDNIMELEDEFCSQARANRSTEGVWQTRFEIASWKGAQFGFGRMRIFLGVPFFLLYILFNS